MFFAGKMHTPRLLHAIRNRAVLLAGTRARKPPARAKGGGFCVLPVGRGVKLVGCNSNIVLRGEVHAQVYVARYCRDVA